MPKYYKGVVIKNNNDYKDFLIDVIQGNPPGMQTKLAKAAGCQQSYLSKVLNGPLHLTPEHADGIARLLALDGLEYELFLELVHWARAGSLSLRAHHAEKIAYLREKLSQFEHQIPAHRLQAVQERYYQSWYFSAIHVLISIPEFQRTEAISRRLNLPTEKVEEFLIELEQMGVAKKEGKDWKHVSSSLHAPSGSLNDQLHLSHWRGRALQAVQEKHASNIHYSGVHSLSKKDKESFLDQLRTLLVQFHRDVVISNEEEAVCLNLDFFPI